MRLREDIQKKNQVRRFLWAGVASILTSACSSVPTRSLPNGGSITQLQVRGVHLRPAGQPGVQGCVPLRKWPSAALRESLEKCFLQIPEGAEIHLRLAREERPFWTLDRDDFQDEQERRAERKLDPLPACLTSELERWESPLEVIFVSPDPQRNLQPGCFSSRLVTGIDRFLSFDWQRMRGKFAWSTHSDRQHPTSASGSFDDWMDAWLLTPFWEPEKGAFHEPVYLPERLCRECLGEKGWEDAIDPRRTEESLWPRR